MAVPPNGQHWQGLGEVVEAYESALARGSRVEVIEFAPPSGHPQGLAILCELVRVDLEYRWGLGRARPLEDYRALFPALFEDSTLAYAMAFEEFRLRVQAGESPAPEEYRRKYGLEERDSEWPRPLPDIEAMPRVADQASFRRLGPGDGASEMGRAVIAYQSYRRQGAGGPEELNSLLASHRVSPAHAELLRSLDRTDPHAAERLAEALSGLPRPGMDFLGFHLQSELGRGAFGKVFLARQGELADRLVALKVSADVAGESHALARLQHTNVVPIFSVHRRGALQAVCMPYLGSTTLADTLASVRSQAAFPRSGEGLLSSLRSRKTTAASTGRVDNGNANARPPSRPGGLPPLEAEPRTTAPLEDGLTAPQIERLRGLGYVPAVLWVASRVADGLAHAHERGILHRDLKPANILFADDGEPVLLDFNLAADLKAHAGASVALVGGTLPYMAPEHLTAFLEGDARVDARSDVYSLGVILYELLTGAHPFPVRTGSVDAIIPQMITDRRGTVPDVRRANPAVSPAVGSIVKHCLEPDPDRRYATARELQEDLSRQLDNQPLRHAPELSWIERASKWARRHPRLTSSTTVAVVAGALLMGVASGFVVLRGQYQRTVAAESSRRLVEERSQAVALLSIPELDSTLVEEGIGLCRVAVERYGVLTHHSWLSHPLAASLSEGDRDRVRRDLGDVLILWVRALIQRASLKDGSRRADDLAQASVRLDRAEACYDQGASTRDLALARAELARVSGKGQGEVRRLVEVAEAIPPRDGIDRLMIDTERVRPEARVLLLSDLKTIERSGPGDFAVWTALGNAFARIGRGKEALTAYNVAVAMAPKLYWVRFIRGVHLMRLREFSQALEDFDSVVDQRPDLAFLLVNRALAKLKLRDAQGAVDDLTLALTLKDAPPRIWFIRARAKQMLGDRQGVHADREQGLKVSPVDPADFVARGLVRLPIDIPGAVADFDAALAIEPSYVHALQDKAHVFSEMLNQSEKAIKLLDVLLEFHPTSVEAIAGRGVLLARQGLRDAALADAKTALALDDRAEVVYQAACIQALTSKQDVTGRAEALRLVAEAVRKDDTWLETARTDPDLEAIRARPEFQELLRALEVVVRSGKSR